jgi:hypothetical protein
MQDTGARVCIPTDITEEVERCNNVFHTFMPTVGMHCVGTDGVSYNRSSTDEPGSHPGNADPEELCIRKVELGLADVTWVGGECAAAWQPLAKKTLGFYGFSPAAHCGVAWLGCPSTAMWWLRTFSCFLLCR